MAAVNDILRATLSIDLPSAVEAQLVFHYRVNSGSESDYTTIAQGIENKYDLAFATAFDDLDAGISANEVALAEWDFVANEWDGKAAVAATCYDGTDIGDMLPHGVAALIRFTTLELRRQARKFLPGFVEDTMVDGAWDAGMLGDLATMGALLNDVIIAGGVNLQPCTFNDTPLSPRFETSSDYTNTALVNTFASYQRRRRPGVGI